MLPSANPADPVVLPPELRPVLERAVSFVINALNLDQQAQPELVAELERAAATAMIEVYAPIAATARRLAGSTEATRTSHAALVQNRSREMAALVAEVATTLRARYERFASITARDARTAALAAAASSVPGHKFAAKKQSAQVAAAVRQAAAARADQHTRTVGLTAAAADEAAAILGMEVMAAAALVGRDASQSAATTQTTALEMCYEVAINAACRAGSQHVQDLEKRS